MVERYYHVSRLAYLPHLLASGAFKPAVELPFRVEERILHVLHKQGIGEYKSEAMLPNLMRDPTPFLVDVHRYFWLAEQLPYALEKAARSQRHTVYLDTPFSERYGTSSPIVYVFDPGVGMQGAHWKTEGAVRHRQVLRAIRASLLGHWQRNWVTTSSIPLSAVRCALVDSKDSITVCEYLQDQRADIPIFPVTGLRDGTSRRSVKQLEERITEFAAQHPRRSANETCATAY